MITAFVRILLLILVSCLRLQATQSETLEDAYLKVYVEMHDAKQLESKGDLIAAYEEYSECLQKFKAMQKASPGEAGDFSEVVKHLSDHLTELKTKIANTPPPPATPPKQ